MKKISFLLTVVLLMMGSCKKQQFDGYMQAEINGNFYYTLDFSSSPCFQYHTVISGRKRYESLVLYIYRDNLKPGIYSIVKPIVAYKDTSGVVGLYYNYQEGQNPEDPVIYYSVSGTINITKIDTGTYNGRYGNIMNLEATYNFQTDTSSYTNRAITVTNAVISFHRK